MKIFTHRIKVELYDSDASGVIFYARLFYFTHQALSAFLNHHEHFIQERLNKKDYFFPVVHTEGDFLSPIYVEDLIDIELQVLHVGVSSFTLGYSLFKKGECVARARTVHVTIHANKSKCELPEKFELFLLDQSF